nr:immunoglobulin heavy chain junction region [Macaca mulatta]MOY18042.1 immunoglobulin heavy chain junction region [Macaca mulatta]MOY18213.1 immunoglobulin heavy chain junction region [Macaca mulatta]MOY18235.1 immunoglobulin heavy chain junction region [Macaca mulatta]MOY18524.1 immunoglobulin heavy chain junction region [Macaca mulatta]
CVRGGAISATSYYYHLDSW